MDTDFWLDLQTRRDLWKAMRSEGAGRIAEIQWLPELARAFAAKSDR